MLKHLDLFSGIGGFSLGLERTGGFKTVAFCEIDPFCQKVLKKHWPDVPIHEDVRSLEYDGPVDIITGGYPCQPFSFAGKRQGQEDDRHLWPAMFELIKKHGPSWIIGENVAGHINMGLDDVLTDLESEGYGCRTFIIPACAIDAPHRRDRVWIVANSDSTRGGNRKKVNAESRRRNNTDDDRKMGRISGIQENVADSKCQGLEGHAGNGARGHKSRRQQEKQDGSAGPGGLCGRQCKWITEPAVGRVAHGIPRRVDRLKSLGNAVVPQIPEIIGYAILEAEK